MTLISGKFISLTLWLNHRSWASPCLRTVCEKGELCDILKGILRSPNNTLGLWGAGWHSLSLVPATFVLKSLLLMGLSWKNHESNSHGLYWGGYDVLRVSTNWKLLDAKSPVLPHNCDWIDSVDILEMLMKSDNFVLNLWEPLPCYESSLGVNLFTCFHGPSINTTPSPWWFEMVVVLTLDTSPLVRTRFRELYSSIAMSGLFETVKSHDDSVTRTYGDPHWTVFYSKRSNFYLHEMNHLFCFWKVGNVNYPLLKFLWDIP